MLPKLFWVFRAWVYLKLFESVLLATKKVIYVRISICLPRPVNIYWYELLHLTNICSTNLFVDAVQQVVYEVTRSFVTNCIECALKYRPGTGERSLSSTENGGWDIFRWLLFYLGVIHKSISSKLADFFPLKVEGVVAFSVKNSELN